MLGPWVLSVLLVVAMEVRVDGQDGMDGKGARSRRCTRDLGCVIAKNGRVV